MTNAEIFVALMSQHTHDIHGNLVCPSRSYTSSALKKATGLPIAEVRKTIDDLCQRGVVKPNGFSVRMTGGKRETIYTITEPKESN